jgi:hypothetical protein
MAPIERITMFKIPNDGDRERLLEQYKALAKTAVKVRLIASCSLLHYARSFFFLPLIGLA